MRTEQAPLALSISRVLRERDACDSLTVCCRMGAEAAALLIIVGGEWVRPRGLQACCGEFATRGSPPPQLASATVNPSCK